MNLPVAPASSHYRVLVAEDDPAIMSLVSFHLRRAGFTALTVFDCAEAWTQFVRHDPHLLLADVHLPGVSGHDLTRRVRATSAVPIVMMTADANPQEQMQGFRVGADDYIAKPFKPELLMARVVANLRRVYRYDSEDATKPANATRAARFAEPPLNKAPRLGLPAGFARCEACCYLGPVWKFDTRDRAGHPVAQCPNCHNRQVTFALA